MARVAARHKHQVKSIDMDRPLLALVLRGTKQVQSGQQRERLGPGDLLAVAPGVRVDVVNTPDPERGCYLTLGLPLPDEVLAAARAIWPAPVVPRGRAVARVPAGALMDELIALADALAADDELRLRMAVLALLIELGRRGCPDLWLPPAPSLAAQVRQLVAQAPARPWTSADVEQTLGLSGATLRRRLAAQGTPLRELIAQARLACALELLYTTRWPLILICIQ